MRRSLTIIVAALVLPLVTPSASAAHQYGCMRDLFGNRFDCKSHKHYRKKKKKVHVAHHSAKWRREQRRLDRESRVYGYHGVDDDSWRGKWKCSEPIRVVGGLKVGLEAAKTDAHETWAASTRWDLGGKWSDWSNARRIYESCAQTRQGKLGGELLHKCAVTATPCKPIRQRGDNE